MRPVRALAGIGNALVRNQEAVNCPLTRLGAELGHIWDNIPQLDGHLRSATPPAQAAPGKEHEPQPLATARAEDHGPAPGARPEDRVDETVLRAVAGISAAPSASTATPGRPSSPAGAQSA
ncbi:hypothetical protein [Streptomyces sp. NPDC055210]